MSCSLDRMSDGEEADDSITNFSMKLFVRKAIAIFKMPRLHSFFKTFAEVRMNLWATASGSPTVSL